MRAKPIFTYSLLAAALAFNGHALALGLGKLTVESALGQPLSARIDLSSVSKDDLDSLRARVADPALYKQNNLTYQATLSRARISVENVGGTPYLKVSSPVAVLEPFLDLLVEVDWSSGRVVREYTFLLDPPGMKVATGPAPAVTAPVAAAPRITQRPAARASAPASAGAASSGAASTGAAPTSQYTVHRGDTLRDVANQFKPDQATLDQMLDALFRRNPEAFMGGNMNRLRAGAILNLPTETEVLGTSAAAAAKTVHAQAVDWNNYRDQLAAAAPAAGAPATRASGGRIGVAVEEKTPAAAPGSDRVEVSRTAGVGKAAATEDAIATEQQLKDAETRIAQLEKTVADMQRALDLKNQTLAQLQGQAEATKGGATTAAAAGAAAASATPAPEGAASSTAAPQPAAPEATAAASSTATPAAEAAKPAAEAAKPAAAGEPAKPAAPKPAATPHEAPGFFTDLVANTPKWALGGGALVILAGIAGLIAARRRTTTKFEDSIISGTDMKTNTVFGSTGGGVVNTGENSLASDFSREGLGNIDTDEVDPIAEAEVYLAYGRDAQAEEILKDALKKDPQRQEIYLKLLEIHSQHNKPSAFETVASELFAVSHGQGDVWHKAVMLGRQLDPANPMFQDEGQAPATARASVSTSTSTPASASVSTPARSGTPPTSGPAAAHAESLEWAQPSFSPELAGAGAKTGTERSSSSSAMEAAAHEAASNDGDISFSPVIAPETKSAADILAGAESALARSATTPVAAVEAAAGKPRGAGIAVAGAATAALGAALGEAKTGFGTTAGALDERVESGSGPTRFDLDFHLDDPVHSAPAAPASHGLGEPALNLEGAHLAPAGAPAIDTSAPLDLDKLDLSFEPTRAASADPTPSVMDGQWHDAATKLDLAKAYQEMGDREGARDILQEVLHEGDEQQKSEAQALLAKLA
ncbi:MAG TPA: FimV/HubP family polar landmark protein [Casimicrobiaceae bacterium]